MNNKTRHGLWLVVGAYLAYTGGQLVYNMMNTKPDNYMLMILFGALFLIVGVMVVVRSFKGIMAPAEDAEEPEEQLEQSAEGVQDVTEKQEIPGENEDSREEDKE